MPTHFSKLGLTIVGISLIFLNTFASLLYFKIIMMLISVNKAHWSIYAQDIPIT